MPDNYNLIIQELVRRSNEETRRLRSIEQRLDAMEDKLSVLSENSNDRMKKMAARQADTEANLTNIANEVTNLRLNLEKIIKQMPKYAQKRDLKELEQMINLLGPARETELEA